MSNKLSLSICLILAGILMWAQEVGTLKGRVIDEDNLSLAGAEINIYELNTYTNTDNRGFYNFLKLESGTYELDVSYFGFQDKTISFTIEPNQTTVLDIQLEKGVHLGSIQLQGSLNGTAKALNQQRNMVNVGNIISSEQVSQFPDDNIGDALKRVPGVNVQYDQGEARFGNIRGTSPDLSSVTLDGNRLPSAEAKVRSFQLDLIPADLVKSIEIHKVVTPDMDGDAIGASVNMVTRSIPSGRRVRLDLSGGYNTIREKANYKGSVLYADRIANNKMGVTFTGSVFDNYIGSENFEAEWVPDEGKNNEMYADDIQIRSYSLQRLRQNYSASIDYKFNENHRIEVGGSYNQRDDYENRMRLRYKKIKWDADNDTYTAKVERETKGGVEKDARLERQKLINFKIKGEHDFQTFQMDWSLISSKANEERPDERYITMAAEDAIAINTNFSDPRNVSIVPMDLSQSDIRNFEVDEVSTENQWTEEVINTALVNFDIPLNDGTYENSLKVGAKINLKTKERENEYYKIEPLFEDDFLNLTLNNIKDYTDSDFQATDLPIGDFVTPAYLGSINFDNDAYELEEDVEELAGNYTATENVSAAYIRFDQKVGKELLFIGGLRVEKTDIEYEGYITKLDDETIESTGKQGKDFTNFMPSLLIKYSPAKMWNLKFGITNTIARPRYFDLVPYQIINQEDREIEIGNPNLNPTNSLNLDIMAERYFKNVGLIELGVFYKDIKDFIVTETYEDYDYNGFTYDDFSRPINAGDASLIGVEFGFQRPLDFISNGLKDFSLYTNYTYINTQVHDFNIEGREDDEDIPLPGSPEHTLNASLAYNTKKVEARISYNYASSFVDEFGKSEFYDRYYDKVEYLDFNFGYNFNKKVNVYFKVNNLLNQPLRYYQGDEDRTMQAEYYGVKYKLGVQINL